MAREVGLIEVVTSLHNPHVQSARKLLRRSHRARAGQFLAEGPLVVLEALRAGAAVQRIFVGDDDPLPGEIESLAASRRVPLLRASGRVIEALSDTATPQGAVAVVDVPRVGLADIPQASSLILLLADVRDPGNAGTLVRSAVAAGADAVVLGSGTVDAFGPKAVRATAGALFRTLVVTNVDVTECVRLLHERGLVILAADAAGVPVQDVDLTRPIALVLGNEARGLAPEHGALADARVAISMPGPVESLNAAIAGSVLLFEAVRQRRAASVVGRALG